MQRWHDRNNLVISDNLLAGLVHKHSLPGYAEFDFNQLYDDAPYIAGIAEFLVSTSTACSILALPTCWVGPLRQAQARHGIYTLADWVTGKPLNVLSFS